MFTKQLAEALADEGYETSKVTDTTLSEQLTEDCKIDVTSEYDDEVIKVKISHPDGGFEATFHTSEGNQDELITVIVDECDYWANS